MQVIPTETAFETLALGVLAEYRLFNNLFVGTNPEVNFITYTFTNTITMEEDDFRGESISVKLPLYLNLELLTEEKISPTLTTGFAQNLNIGEDAVRNISRSFSEFLLELGVTVKNNYFMWTPYIGYNRSLSNPLDVTFTNVNGDIIDTKPIRQGFHVGVRFKG